LSPQEAQPPGRAAAAKIGGRTIGAYKAISISPVEKEPWARLSKRVFIVEDARRDGLGAHAAAAATWDSSGLTMVKLPHFAAPEL
jgi:hypothetical protein